LFTVYAVSLLEFEDLQYGTGEFCIAARLIYQNIEFQAVCLPEVLDAKSSTLRNK